MIAAIVERHADEASFLWSLRAAAALAPHHRLASLCELDERVEANLDGLRVAGDVGWKICARALDEEEPGTIFAATVLAVERGDLEGVAAILDAAGATPGLAQGIVSGLGWIAFETIRGILPGLLHPTCPPPLHAIGIAACSVHRQDPGPMLAYSLLSDDLALRARALRAVGELGQVHLLADVQSQLDAADDECRFFAAWSAALFGDPRAVEVLWGFARSGGRRADRASALLMRRVDPAAAPARIEALAGLPATRRAAVTAAGALGDPARIPWLIEGLTDPAIARLCGESLTMITGVDLAAEHLTVRAPADVDAGPSDDPADDRVAADPDEHLPWPDVDGVKAWWARHALDLPRGRRFLLGKPLESEWLQRVLREGKQRQRAAAALELAILGRGRPLFEVRAPGFAQAIALGS
jgi:uncharacterized protein (TIGR02270 family)